MSRRINKFTWLEAQNDQQQLPGATGIPGNPAQEQPSNPNPNSNPQDSQKPLGQQGQELPNTPPQSDPNQLLEPVAPDMPEDNDEVEFNAWRDEFFKLAISGDVEQMLDSINTIRDHELKSSQTKFVEDNYQILLLRQDANFDKTSRAIRKAIKTSVDKEHPGVSLMQIIMQELDPNPVLSEILIKLYGYHGLKGELHRKMLAAMSGSIQCGGGGAKEDLVFCDKEYSINISTRIASNFGEINLGQWSLQEDEAGKFLEDPELARLKEGSPEEKKALVHRIIVDSICEQFKTRAFLIHVVLENNTYSIGWDIGNCLKDSFKEGKIIVKSNTDSDNNVVVSEDGEFIPLKNIGLYAKINDTGMDEDGSQEGKDAPFIENRSGTLYFVADMETINSVAGNLSGMLLLNRPYTGSPVEFRNLTRHIVPCTELLLRRS